MKHLAALAFLVLLAACSESREPAPQALHPIVQGEQIRFPAGHPQLAALTSVAAVPATSIVIELPARLVWNEERTQRVYPAFAGRVVGIDADVGQAVRRGQALARLASPDFGTAQAESAKAQADLHLTRIASRRVSELFEAGIVPRKDVDQAEADAARASAEAARATSRTRLYGAAGSGTVDQQLALRTGVSGIVVERNLNPGQELRPDQSGPGAPAAFVVTDPTSLWVQLDAREAEAATLRPGAPFDLVVPSLPGEIFRGHVVTAADAIDPASRTIKIRGVVPNPQRRLKAEMLGTARLEQAQTGGVVVPAEAIRLNGAQHSVFVQVQPGAFESRVVTVGHQGPRESIVRSGLAAGEQVVTRNVLLLTRQYRLALEDTRPGASAASTPSIRASSASAASARTAP